MCPRDFRGFPSVSGLHVELTSVFQLENRDAATPGQVFTATVVYDTTTNVAPYLVQTTRTTVWTEGPSVTPTTSAT